jgi:putative sterol carrier protein
MSVLRYLSLDWIDALTAEVAASAEMAAVAVDHSVGVTQVVSDGPEGTVVYHVLVAHGRASFGAGPAEPEDLRFEQDWATAVDVATGTLNAQEAFLAGRIRLFGEPPTLIANQAVFRALDGAFSAVREHTDYT